MSLNQKRPEPIPLQRAWSYPVGNVAPRMIGLDVHKETIATAVAEPGWQEPCSEGEIANRPKSIEKLVRRLSERFDGGVLQFVYEAGPCGYGLYR